eukprot:9761275-Karenia_brevis.AAC.2
MDSSVSKHGTKPFAVNVNAGGNVHRVVSRKTGRCREKRALCGWRAGSVVAKAMFCKRVAAGKLCRKCFHDASAQTIGDELEGDAIDDSE